MATFDTPILQVLRQNQSINNGDIKIKKARPMFTGMTIERQYQRRLRNNVVGNIKEIINIILIPKLQSILESAKLLRPTTDSDRMDQQYGNVIIATMHDVRIGYDQSFPDFDKMLLARETGELTSNFQRNQIKQLIASQVGVDVFFSEPWLQEEMTAFVESNIGLIKTISDEAFDDIEQIVFRGAQRGLLQEEIVQQIRDRVDIATSKANLIARDQINKFFGHLNELRQRSVGIKEYIWRSADDNRVRPSHIDKDDRTFSWDKPPADTGHPGNDFQCRCYAEPKIASLLLELREAA